MIRGQIVRSVLVVLVVFGAVFWIGRSFFVDSKPVVSKTPTSNPVAAGSDIQEGSEVSLPKPRRIRSRTRNKRGDDPFKEIMAEIDKLLQSNNPDEAKKLLEEILRKDPKNERALEELGMMYVTEYQSPEKAVEFFRKVLDVNPNNEFALMEMVGISSHPDRSQEALQYLKGLQERHPDSAVLSDGVGELLLTQGKYAEAIPHLEKSAKDPKYAEFAHTRMASVFQQMGDFPKAIESYRKAILHQRDEIGNRKTQGFPTEMVESDMARSQLDLAQLLIKENRPEEAEALIEKARERLGSDWEVDALLEQLRGGEGHSTF